MSEEHPYGIRLVVAYDGREFHGYQLQDKHRTVQGVLEETIAKMAGHPVRVRGAGRTDAGVHAMHQLVAFDAARNIPPRGWMLGLNVSLPDDLSIVSAASVPAGYDPRFDAKDKTYRYLVLFNEPRHPTLRHISWHMPHARLTGPEFEGAPPLVDVKAMREAAAVLVGRHDFAAFRASDDNRRTTIREIFHIKIEECALGHPELLSIEVRGQAFMKNMVRILAGTLVDVGRNRRTPEEVRSLLTTGTVREAAGQTAPARGLTLMHITLGRRYPIDVVPDDADVAPDDGD